MDLILQWDLKLFEFLNISAQNGFFDVILPLVRNRYIWLPLYIFIISYSLYKMGFERGSSAILIMISCVVITDVVSGVMLKKTVERPRPCQVLEKDTEVISRVHCSTSFSFPSSHATNHFGMAIVFFTLLGAGKRWVKYSLLIWAGVIGLSQIYVGIHYPTDILFGALLGILLAKTYLKTISNLVDSIRVPEFR